MDFFGFLVVLAVMFAGALGAGYLPYLAKAPRDAHLKVVSAAGAGLLIGAALAIVIPEGFAAHAAASAAAAAAEHAAHAGHGHGDEEHGHEGHAATGLALVAGFLAMLLLEQAQLHLGGDHHHHHHHHHHGTAGHQHGRASPSKGQPAPAAPAPPQAAAAAADAAGAAEKPTKATPSAAAGADAPERALAGLLVHCAADGLAMGAAARGGSAAGAAAVAAAMVLHKAPMALGLSAYLLSARWPWARARPALAAFAAAAPAAALATYGALGAVPALASAGGVALALLFSGGTFLYAAAVHVLPEVAGGERLPGAALAAVAGGALAPALLAAAMGGHEH